MEDQFTTITTNIPEIPAGEECFLRIKDLVEQSPDLTIRPVKLNQKGGFVIQSDIENIWLVVIEPWKNRVLLKDFGNIPFNNRSEEIILLQILKYYHDQVA